MSWGYDFELCVCSLRSITYSGITAICFSVYVLGKNAGRLIYRLQTSLGAPSTLISDYMHFARWYYNHKPHREWDEHDYTRHKRFITFQSHAKAQAEHKRQEHLKKLPPHHQKTHDPKTRRRLSNQTPPPKSKEQTQPSKPHTDHKPP